MFRFSIFSTRYCLLAIFISDHDIVSIKWRSFSSCKKECSSKNSDPIYLQRQQIEKLAQCEAEHDNPSIEEILEAFLVPPLAIVLNSGDRSTHCARFMGCCPVEPDPIREIAEPEFRGNQKAFLDAFGRSLPDFSRNELAWKLDLVIAVLVQVLGEAKKPNALIQDNSPEHIQLRSCTKKS